MYVHEIELEFEGLVFVEEGKPDDLLKNPWSKEENQQQTQPTYECWAWESNLGHTGGRQALSPLRFPQDSFICINILLKTV